MSLTKTKTLSHKQIKTFFEIHQIETKNDIVDLHKVCVNGDFIKMINLIQNGAKVDVLYDGNTLFHSCVKCNNHSSAKIMIEYLVNNCNILSLINIKNTYGDTILHILAKNNNCYAFEYIIPFCEKSLINEKNYKNNTPIEIACLNSNLNIIYLLIDNLFNINLKEESNNKQTSINIMFKHLIDENYKDFDKYISLFVKLLELYEAFDNNGKYNISDKMGLNINDYHQEFKYVFNSKLNNKELIIKTYLNCNQFTLKNHNYLFSIQLTSNDSFKIFSLLSTHPDFRTIINEKDNLNKTILMKKGDSIDKSIVEFMLTFTELDLTIQDYNGDTLLHYESVNILSSNSMDIINGIITLSKKKENFDVLKIIKNKKNQTAWESFCEYESSDDHPLREELRVLLE